MTGLPAGTAGAGYTLAPIGYEASIKDAFDGDQSPREGC